MDTAMAAMTRLRPEPRHLPLVLALIAVAALVALMPPGAATVERLYARGLYPVIQSTITPLCLPGNTRFARAMVCISV